MPNSVTDKKEITYWNKNTQRPGIPFIGEPSDSTYIKTPVHCSTINCPIKIYKPLKKSKTAHSNK
jgi:hypothetical protein